MLLLLENKGGLMVLCTWRCHRGKHRLRNVGWSGLIVYQTLRMLLAFVHWGVIRHWHHLMRAGWQDCHWQAVRMWVWREVAMLSVLRARIRVVVKER